MLDSQKLISDLQQKNRELVGKVAVLQKQFDEALIVAHSFDAISAKNTELEKEIHLQKSRNEDLTSRIQILAQSNAELTHKYNEEKASIQSRSKSEMFSVQEKLKQTQIDYEKEIADLKIKSQKVEKENFITVENYKKQLQRIYDAATHYFSSNIHDSDVLISLLLTKTQPKQALQTPSVLIHEAPSNANHKSRNSDEGINDKVDKEVLLAMKEYRSEAKSLKNKNQKLQALLKEQSQTTEALSNEKESLIKINAKLTSQLEKVKQKCDESKTFVIQVKDLQARNIKLRTKLTTYAKNTENLQQKNSDINEKINACKALIIKKDEDIQKLSKENNQMKEELSIIEKKNQELKEKYFKASEMLKNNQVIVDEKKQETKNVKTTLNSLQDVLDNQKDEILQLQTQRLKLISQIQSMNSLLTQYESSVNSLLTKKTKTIPNQSFAYTQFPEELKTKILKSLNDYSTETITDEDMVRNTLAVVYNYYNTKLNSLNEEVSMNNVTVETEKQKLNLLILEISKLYPDILYDASKPSTFSGNVEKLRVYQEKLMNEKRIKENEINEIYNILNSSTIEEIKSKVEEMKNEIQQLKDKIKAKKAEEEQLLLEYQQYQKEFADKMKVVKHTLAQTEQKMVINEKDWKTEKSHYDNKIKELTSTVNANKEQVKLMKKEFHDKLHKETRNVSKLGKDNQSIKDENAQLNQTICELQKDISTKEDIIFQLRSFTKFFAKKQSLKHKKEQEMLKNQLNQIIAQLKEKNVELKNTLDEVRDKMILSESQYHKAKTQISEYCSKIQQLELKLESFQSDAERNRSLIESKSKAAQIAQETQLQSQIEDSKWQIENAKREIMAYVGMQFSSLFNAKARIDESNFESFVHKLRKKFDDLISTENNLRHMLSLNSSDSVESAVSHLIRQKTM
ncbi:hypothetical protein TRFO_15987 [Tritrichomonas foetus]|uniref:Uncharacterized protein n=1 Tax=Tritrichomonas foetus TaxID=1144522 RepID=A0A1J4KRA0_9EUKA|nr:hypothetical protein TRFO_15987 [Tritrichomonas foetus]|eukprot:OHT13771.1 hypothetical protein TRFO_15987 [Tritrichomonas foetus]